MFSANRLKAQMALKGITAKELAKSLDINESTFYRKLRNDEAYLSLSALSACSGLILFLN